jgi:FAD/FMN-containing dehydrogenase
MTFATILEAACPGLALETSDAILETYGKDWSDMRGGPPSAVAFPDSEEQVCQLVLAARRSGTALVPSGGRTGLSGGAVPLGGEVVVSFERMRRIVAFDRVDRTVTVEAGVTTSAVQQFAREKGFYYPVSFASEGSSHIGGNIATNAGGIRVLRYGLTRDRVAGLRVVTGRGDVLDCNRGLVKNASGYDLRHLFVGSEGTLGLVVEATLRLAEPPPPSRVMLLALPDLGGLMSVFGHLRSRLTLSAFEFLDARSMSHVRRADDLPAPVSLDSPWYVITEFDCAGEDQEQSALAAFEECARQGWLSDGVISQSERQIAELWRYLEGIAESVAPRGPYKNDLSVGISRVPEFLTRLQQLLKEHYPDYDVLCYGHIGDGNVHLNILRPEHVSEEVFKARCEEISEKCYELTANLGGSASAEHGIGVIKAPWLGTTRSAAEIELMRGIKDVFDPDGILNPGKLLSSGSGPGGSTGP